MVMVQADQMMNMQWQGTRQHTSSSTNILEYNRRYVLLMMWSCSADDPGTLMRLAREDGAADSAMAAECKCIKSFVRSAIFNLSSQLDSQHTLAIQHLSAVENDRPRDVPHKYSSPAVTPSSTSATKAGTDTPAAVTEPYAAPTIQKHAPKPHSQLGGALSGRVEAYRGGGNVAKSGALFCDSVCYRSLL